MPASVIMHDYNNSYNQRDIPIAYMQGIPDPESSYEDHDGGVWTVTSYDVYPFTGYKYTRSGKILTSDKLYSYLDEIGLGSLHGFELADYLLKPAFQNGNFGKGEDSRLAPYLITQWELNGDQELWRTGYHVLAEDRIFAPPGYIWTDSTAGYRMSAPLAIVTSDGHTYWGVVNAYNWTGWTTFNLEIVWTEEVSDENFYLFDGVPGDKGYVPTGTRYKKHKPGIGGKGHNPDPDKNPSYHSDNITNPGAPDETSASVIGSGLVRAYKIDKTNLANLCTCLYGTTLGGLITNLSINPLDFIISLNIFPCAPSVGTSTNVVLGRWVCTDSGIDSLGGNVSASPLSAQFKVIDFGTVEIHENWGSFLDYSHTQIELYLPFIGTVDIDTAEVMDGSIALSYTIDFLTGMCVANVNCNRTVELPDGKIKNQKSQHSFQGNCAMTIPLSQASYGNIIGSLINAGTSGMRGGLLGAGISVASDVASGGFMPSITTKGSLSANAGFCGVTYPYVRVIRPISAESDSFQEVVGYPSYIDSTLGDCTDLCVCESIDLHSITGATDSEIERIRQMCLEGVHV